jgi:hypothetical protein
VFNPLAPRLGVQILVPLHVNNEYFILKYTAFCGGKMGAHAAILRKFSKYIC